MADRLRELRKNQLFELAFTVVLALGLALTVQAYALKPYRIPSGSMEPTLDIGQRVLVERVTHRLGDSPAVGEVVVFHPPVGADDDECGQSGTGVGTHRPCARAQSQKDTQNFIKRVVAVGGDTVAIVDGHVIRNGSRVAEPFAQRCMDHDACNFPDAIAIPPGHVFLMGDNRGNSDDSRYWGPIPVSWIIGRAFATYWPPSRLGGL